MYRMLAALTMMPISGDSNSAAGMPHSPYTNIPGFGAAMAAAMANQQFASLMTSQGLPFMPHAIQAMYSSPTSKYLHTSTTLHKHNIIFFITINT